MGRGAFYARSACQKLNTTSTTESELVGASDCLGQTLWTVNFLEHQGIKVRKNYYYQDNESAIRLEKNGIKSAGKRSQHINIRFYFIKETSIYCIAILKTWLQISIPNHNKALYLPA